MLVGDVFQPIDNLAIEAFLDCDVGEGSSWGSAVPMLLTRRKPNDVAGMNFLDGAAIFLHPAAAGSHDEGLSKGMGVPGGACSRLEGDTGAGDQRWVGRLKEWINADGAGKPICRTLAGWLRADAFNIHDPILKGRNRFGLLLVRR